MRSVSLALLAVAGLHFLSAAAAPANNTNVEACADPLIRHEWRQLSLEQRLDYIDSIKCLMALPSEGNDLWPGAKSRYDDFQGMHIYMTKQVHFNVSTLPYWDMGLDNTAEGFAKSPVFDNVYGVGGNGPYIANITDPEDFPVQKPIEIPERSGGGKFTLILRQTSANLMVQAASKRDRYSVESTPHCLRRDFSLPIITGALSDEVINRTLSATSFDEFNLHIQGYSMQVADMYSSPGDPVFYFIHGALDKIWNEWQRMDWPARKMDIGGPDIIWAYPFNFFGDVAYENITLQYPLSFPNFSGNMTVAEVMDIQGGPFCYEYK
ncbi:hypothetical protein COL154_012038 [Colletotrichum chrysophilum]|nr:hypothetical protein COL154_012038 [Colletotrichum chrysophilum]